MKAFIDCFGCEIRHLDMQQIINYLRKNRIELIENPSKADLLIIITCAVSRFTEIASLELITRVDSARSKWSKLIIGGCLPSISGYELERFNVDHTFSPRAMRSLDFYLKDIINISIHDIDFPNRSPFDEGRSTEKKGSNARDRYDLAKRGFKVVITHGCVGNCKYCMVRYATGRTESVPMDHILKQIALGIEQNEKTIMLRGGDTGAYGLDIDTNLPQLIGKIISIKGQFELFVHDCNINWIIRDLEDFKIHISSNKDKRKLVSMNLPIQSGSDKILKMMRRPYTIGEVIPTLTIFKEMFPWIEIGTHIMVGFPGETEEDFIRSLELIDRVGFDYITCFPYSEHKDADSAHLPNKVLDAIIKTRIKHIKKEFGNIIKVVE